MKIRATIVLISLVAMVGRTTMRPIDAQRSDLTDKVEIGDNLVVYEKSGRIFEMTVAAVTSDTLAGTLGQNGSVPIEIGTADIEKIEIEKIDGAKTTLAVIGGTIVVVPLVILAAIVGADFSSY